MLEMWALEAGSVRTVLGLGSMEGLRSSPRSHLGKGQEHGHPVRSYQCQEEPLVGTSPPCVHPAPLPTCLMWILIGPESQILLTNDNRAGP